MKMPRSRRSGFTLMELMIVLAIIAILAAIALPSYLDSVRKGRRAEARAAILNLLQQQERYMTQQNTYLGFSNAVGTTNPATAASIFKVYSGDSNSSPSYWLSADVCSATELVNECVKITATPTGSDPQVGALSMTSSGMKSCTGTAATTEPNLCWP